MSEPGRDRQWKKVLFEYIANLDENEDENENGVPDMAPMISDPRVNHQARRMVDWFKREMEARHLSPEKEAALLNGVRRAIRQELAEVPVEALEERKRG